MREFRVCFFKKQQQQSQTYSMKKMSWKWMQILVKNFLHYLGIRLNTEYWKLQSLIYFAIWIYVLCEVSYPVRSAIKFKILSQLSVELDFGLTVLNWDFEKQGTIFSYTVLTENIIENFLWEQNIFCIIDESGTIVLLQKQSFYLHLSWKNFNLGMF